jgi:hypothetical protein
MRSVHVNPCLALPLLLAAAAAAEDATAPPTAEWVVTTSFGAGSAGGGWGRYLEKPVLFDLNLSKGHAWRFGFGLQFGSLAMKAPYEDEPEWAHHETYLFASRVFRSEHGVRPYLQARAGLARTHPRSALFFTFAPEPGSPLARSEAADGFAFTLQPGVELELSAGLALDVAGFWNVYRTEDYDMSPIGGEPVGDGREWGFKAGLAWRPLASAAAGGLVERDAWGVPKSWGYATATLLVINYAAAMFSEYQREREFTQISPRSFWRNLERGFEKDDDTFKTNQLAHPWNGGMYFNSGRANGIGFWGSSALALSGAFLFECCGETHPMSFNDVISTGVGGIALGETLYRLSSLVIDNTSSGAGRLGRETAAIFLDPVRGATRLLSGRAWRSAPNPEDPFDRRPPQLLWSFFSGGRTMGEEGSFTGTSQSDGFLAVDLDFGSAWDNARRRPYDRFDLASEWNFQDQLGRLQVRGDLFSRPLGDGTRPRHTWAVTQDFDYIDNEAYKHAGQSLGLALYSRTDPEASFALETRLEGFAVLLGAINADFTLVGEPPEGTLLRRNDYGPGLGAAVELRLLRAGRAFFLARYRLALIHADTSVFEEGEQGLAADADHAVHEAVARLIVPIGPHLGVGADATLFYRNSRYRSSLVEDTDRRNAQARVFLLWRGGP